MAAPARIVPWKADVVIVTAASTHQYTLQACAPFRSTENPVPVRAPGASVPILKIQRSFELPTSVSVVSVNVAAAGKQYTPGVSESAWPVKAACVKVWV